MAKTTKGAMVVKKKKWVTIMAPKIFNEQPIGETHVGDAQEAVGRLATVSLMTLTGDPQKQSTNIVFKIKGIEGDKLTTEAIGYFFIPSALKRFMRRGKTKIEDSYKLTAADGSALIVKPFIILRGAPTGGIVKDVRKAVKAHFTKTLQKTSFEAFFKDIISRKFQRSLMDAIKKIYPLAACEIKYLRLTSKGSTPVPEQSEVQKTPPEEPAKKQAEEQKA